MVVVVCRWYLIYGILPRIFPENQTETPQLRNCALPAVGTRSIDRSYLWLPFVGATSWTLLGPFLLLSHCRLSLARSNNNGMLMECTTIGGAFHKWIVWLIMYHQHHFRSRARPPHGYACGCCCCCCWGDHSYSSWLHIVDVAWRIDYHWAGMTRKINLSKLPSKGIRKVFFYRKDGNPRKLVVLAREGRALLINSSKINKIPSRISLHGFTSSLSWDTLPCLSIMSKEYPRQIITLETTFLFNFQKKVYPDINNTKLRS